MIVGAVGNLRYAKAYDVLLEAVAQLARRDPSMRFVIAGDDTDGLLASLESQRDRLGIADRVRFTGFGRDVAAFLNGLDVFVLPSRSEGFSLATVEAMSCGLPVVVTRSGGPDEIVEDGRNGLMVPSESASAIAEALGRLASDATLRERLGNNARDRAIQDFDVASMVQRYEALYVAL